jgi:hypothetical protein
MILDGSACEYHGNAGDGQSGEPVSVAFLNRVSQVRILPGARHRTANAKRDQSVTDREG